MTGSSVTYRRAGTLVIGIVFTAQLIKTVWLEIKSDPSAADSVLAFDAAMVMIESPLWVAGGALHIAVAAALYLLALPAASVAGADSRPRYPGTVAAGLGAVLFLLLGIAHLAAVPQIGDLAEYCAADGRTAFIAYEILRTILLFSAFFGLGGYLLADSANRLRADIGPAAPAYVGLLAGLLCLLFVFTYPAMPLLAGVLMTVSVALWGLVTGLSRVRDREPRSQEQT